MMLNDVTKEILKTCPSPDGVDCQARVKNAKEAQEWIDSVRLLMESTVKHPSGLASGIASFAPCPSPDGVDCQAPQVVLCVIWD